MSSIAFDTLKYVETLTSAGFSEPQAKAMAHAQQAVLVNLSERQLATKLDVINLGNKVEMDIANLSNKVEVDIANLTNKIDKDIADLTNKIDKDIANLSNKVNTDIANLSNKIDKDIANLRIDNANLNNKIDKIETELKGKFNLLYWMNGFMLTFIVAIAFKLFL